MCGEEENPKLAAKHSKGDVQCKIEVDRSKTILNVQSCCTNLRTAQKLGKRARHAGKSPKPAQWARKHPVRGSRRGAEVRDSESISPAQQSSGSGVPNAALQMNEGKGGTRLPSSSRRDLCWPIFV